MSSLLFLYAMLLFFKSIPLLMIELIISVFSLSLAILYELSTIDLISFDFDIGLKTAIDSSNI